jgi:(p)ppGpp synthase/HD superfamily hydrolase
MSDLFFKALLLAADKHSDHRRKGSNGTPYINHLIKVAEILHTIGLEKNDTLLAAALLHDVIEDTPVTKEELSVLIGADVANLVAEVTDDMTLTYEERKREQIKKALFISEDAKKIKIADKISNINDMLNLPVNWSDRRKIQYLEWSEQVIANCKGVNKLLDDAFDKTVTFAKSILYQ